jgi:hypothetical protein
MDIESAMKWLTGEWAAIGQAPVIFFAAVVVLTFAIWKINKWLTAERFQNMQSRIDLLNERLQQTEDRRAPPVPPLVEKNDDALIQPPIKTELEPPSSIYRTADTPSKIPSAYSAAQILNLYASRTRLQADLVIESEVGKWIELSGEVVNVSKIGDDISVSVVLDGDSSNVRVSSCHFDDHHAAAASLCRSDHIIVFGCLTRADLLGVSLDHCELREVSPAPPPIDPQK